MAIFDIFYILVYYICSMKTKYFTLFITLFFLAGCQSVIDQPAVQAQNEPGIINQSPESVPAISPVKPEEATTTEPLPVDPAEAALEIKKELPGKLDWPVLFTSQAPYGVWDQLHGEACEEAAMITVAKYFKDQPLNAHIAEQEILDLVNWEEDHNYQVDLTAQEAVDILSQHFGLSAELSTQVTVERIKEELAAGKLIILPAAGRLLNNPYFQQPGPIYHMLVIRGYNESEFITNDPGTRRGEGFRYKFQTLLNASHDWDHQLAQDGMTDEEIASTQKVMIVVAN